MLIAAILVRNTKYKMMKLNVLPEELERLLDSESLLWCRDDQDPVLREVTDDLCQFRLGVQPVLFPELSRHHHFPRLALLSGRRP